CRKREQFFSEYLNWDISPKNGQEVFFSHELYEKYSLSPSLSELWHLSNRKFANFGEFLIGIYKSEYRSK
uniref:Uncharacterized protein n=1 Tax=Ficedula albicollis TaxID=59894 RepID=A0A803WBL4_FICAL